MYEKIKLGDSVYQRIAKDWASQRSNMQISPEDIQLLERAKRDTEETADESIMAEATVGLIPRKAGWLGNPGEIFVQATNEFDDRINHVDGVKEILSQLDGKPFIFRWAEDVTRWHPDTNPGSLRGREKVREKVANIRKHIEQEQNGYGRDAGRTKYIQSIAMGEIRVEMLPIRSMPMAIISLPDGVIEELLELQARVTAGDVDAKEDLFHHPARKEYLAQILAGLEAQIALLRNKYEEFNSEEFKEALERAETVAVRIRFLLGDDHYEMSNQWLKEAYELEFGEYMDKA